MGAGEQSVACREVWWSENRCLMVRGTTVCVMGYLGSGWCWVNYGACFCGRCVKDDGLWRVSIISCTAFSCWPAQHGQSRWSMALVRWFCDRSNNRQIPNIHRQHSQSLIYHTRISLSIMCWLWPAWLKRHQNRMDIQRRGQFQCHHKGVLILQSHTDQCTSVTVSHSQSEEGHHR